MGWLPVAVGRRGRRCGGTVPGPRIGAEKGVDEHIVVAAAVEECAPRRSLEHEPALLGDSAAPSTIAKLQRALGGRMIDLLFIDGNHSYEGAKRDYEAYYPLTRHLVALHDLLCETHADVKVGELWRELKRKAKDHTFVLFHRPRGHIESAVWGGQEMGIGVLVKDVDAGVGAK